MRSILYWLGLLSGWIVMILLISIPFMRRDKRKMKRRYESAFVGRESLDEQTFYERYFRNRDIPTYIVTGVREVLESVLATDLSRLSAEDDLTKNLKFALDADSLADVEIITMLEDRFRIRIADADAERATTVRDIVDLVWANVQQQNP